MLFELKSVKNDRIGVKMNEDDKIRCCSKVGRKCLQYVVWYSMVIWCVIVCTTSVLKRASEVTERREMERRGIKDGCKGVARQLVMVRCDVMTY